MKLEIKRVSSETKALLGGLKFNYNVNVTLMANDDEKKLWYKYKYYSKDILVLSSIDFIPSFEKNVKGGRYTSFGELLAGHTWESKEPYLIFTEIPTIIKENLICMNEELNMREHWNENDETVDLA